MPRILTVGVLVWLVVAVVGAGVAWGAPTNGKIAFNRFDPLLGGPRPFTIDPDGTHEVALPGGAHDTSLFCHGWAPDGSRIAVCVDNAFGFLRAATMNPDGTGYTLLDPNPALDLSAACSIWSPDAARLGHGRGSGDQRALHGTLL